MPRILIATGLIALFGAMLTAAEIPRLPPQDHALVLTRNATPFKLADLADKPYRQLHIELPGMPGALKGSGKNSHTAKLTLGCRGAVITQAWVTGTIANAPDFVADASKLKLTGGKLVGEVNLDVFKSLSGPFTVTCTVGATITGTFTHQESGKTITVSGVSRSEADLHKRYAIAAGQDYPCWRGSEGNGSAQAYDGPVVDSLQQARLVWASEEYAPASYYETRRSGGSLRHHYKHQSGITGPVVVDGKVYTSFFMPSGEELYEPTAQKIADGKAAEASGGKRLKWQAAEDWVHGMRIRADEILVCIDAATGKTLWKTVYKDAGNSIFNMSIGNDAKLAIFSVPVVAYGKVIYQGLMGEVFCCDAETGAKLWTAIPGPAFHKEYQDLKAQRLAKKAWLKGKYRGGPICCAPSYGGGVFLVPDGKNGLVGLDAKTGAVRWGPIAGSTGGRRGRGQGAPSPMRWVNQGKDRIITGRGMRVLCLDPATGKILWDRDDMPMGIGSAATSGDILVIAATHLNKKGHKDQDLGMHAYRISDSGAKLLWKLDGSYQGFSYSSPVIAEGRVYGHIKAPKNGYMVCLDLETGKELARSKAVRHDNGQDFCAAYGWLHSKGLGGSVPLAPSKLAGSLFWRLTDDNAWHMSNEGSNMSPCASCQTTAAADGRIFMRGQDGVFCYDLRRP